jgi:hypothetical protein
MTEIHGNTYPVREKLKGLGGKWSAARKCWLVPDDRADEAKALVAGAPQSARCGGVRVTRGPRACATCRARINYGVYCGKCEFRR